MDVKDEVEEYSRRVWCAALYSRHHVTGFAFVLWACFWQGLRCIVSTRYCNSRVLKFSKEGNLLKQWGRPNLYASKYSHFRLSVGVECVASFYLHTLTLFWWIFGHQFHCTASAMLILPLPSLFGSLGFIVTWICHYLFSFCCSHVYIYCNVCLLIAIKFSAVVLSSQLRRKWQSSLP